MVAVVVLVVMSLVLVMLALAGAAQQQAAASCAAAAAGAGGVTGPPANANETAYVQTIIGVAKTLGIPEQGWVVALATAIDESGIRNLANPVVPASLALTNDGTGSDHDSVGIFQQRPSQGWGTPAQIMNPAYAAEAFFGARPAGGTGNRGLAEIPNWLSLPITVAAQAVQASATPTAYQQFVGPATQLAAANAAAPAVALPLPAGNTGGPGSPGGGSASGGTSCPGGTGQPSTVAATPGSYYNPLRGISGLTAERVDQGVDYAGAGPLYAIGDGVVLSTTNGGWPGGAFIAVRLSDGPATGAVVYEAENIAPSVAVGQQVTANTVLGVLRDAAPNLEIGWGSPSAIGSSLAQGYGGYGEGLSTAAGVNFNQLLVKLGAPSGRLQAVNGTLPAGWPAW